MKLNVVIDASGMFYRSLFTVGNFGGAKGEKLLDTKKSQGIFMRKLATDFSTMVREVDNPNRVIVCLDSSSWRKAIEISDGGYKGDREEKKQESPINWNSFFDLTDKFASILSQKGYLISRVPGAEADDLLFFWSRLLNDMCENVMMITGDRDLLQVVRKHDNGSWTIGLDPVNSRKKISLTQEVYENVSVDETENVDIFNPSSWSSTQDVLAKILNNYELNIVDVRKFCTKKVIVGDGGDAVPSIVSWRDKKDPSKIRTMTDNNFEKILLAAPGLNDATWQDIYEGKFCEEICSTMEGLKKIEVDRELVKEHMKRNSKLVILSFDTIPEQIHNNFLDTVKDGIPEEIAVTGRDAMLNGSEWWTNDKTAYVPKSFDLF